MVKLIASTLAALTFLLAGCAGESEIEAPVNTFENPSSCGGKVVVEIDPALQAEFGEDITWATSVWQKLISNTVDFSSVAANKNVEMAFRPCVLQVNLDNDFRQETGKELAWGSRQAFEGQLWSGVIGFDAGRMDTLSKDVDGMHHAVFRATMLHELGHVLGLEHDSDTSHESVMWPVVTVPAQVGCEDVRRVCATTGCTPSCDGVGWTDDTTADLQAK